MRRRREVILTRTEERRGRSVKRRSDRGRWWWRKESRWRHDSERFPSWSFRFLLLLLLLVQLWVGGRGRWRPRFFHHTITFLCSHYRFFPPFIEEPAASSAAAAIILGLLHFNPARSWLQAPGLVMQRRVSNQWGLVGPCACLGSWSIDFWCKADEVKSREIKERQRGGRVIKVLKEKNKEIVQFHILSTHNISGFLLNLQ